MIFQIKKYLSFLLRSTNQHGVHSPFVYDFVTKCLYDKTRYEDYNILNNYKNALLKDDFTLKITDFGSGSRVFKSNNRKVSDIAKHAGATHNRMKLLYRVVNYFEPKEILELGTSLGLSTISLALAKNTRVTSLEGCPETSAKANDSLIAAGVENVSILKGDFTESIHNLLDKNFDLIYIDGNHSKDATLAYFEKLLPTATNDSVWIFDDIYWSEDMQQAWKCIQSHPKVQVTVDCFWLGFVFFRKEQREEHFAIRL